MAGILWVEALDSIIKKALQNLELVNRISHESMRYWLSYRWCRIESFQLLLRETHEWFSSKSLDARNLFSGEEKQSVRWAYKQFDSLDYKLIELCYGRLSQHIYLLQYSREMDKRLDRYLIHRDSEALKELFEIAHQAYADSPKQGNREILSKIAEFDALVEEIWPYAMLRIAN